MLWVNTSFVVVEVVTLDAVLTTSFPAVQTVSSMTTFVTVRIPVFTTCPVLEILWVSILLDATLTPVFTASCPTVDTV